jgi:hypothetical protein
VEVGELGSEESPSFERRIDATITQHLTKDGMHTHLCGEAGGLVGFFLGRGVVVPLIYHGAGDFVESGSPCVEIEISWKLFLP